MVNKSDENKQEGNLNESEQAELKLLKSERQRLEGHLTDSQRIRMSELLDKENPDRQRQATEAAAQSKERNDFGTKK